MHPLSHVYSWFRGYGRYGLCILLLATNSGWSLPEDKHQLIHIESDQVEQITKHAREITTYTGDVVMTQGSLLLKGDQIVVYSQQRSVLRIVADGSPAQFQQQPALDKAWVYARANCIDYDIAADTVLLLNNAYVEQANSSIVGDRIDYHVTTGHIQAISEANTESRVHMVLDPDNSDGVIQEAPP